MIETCTVAANELFAEDFVNHSPNFGVSTDRDGLIQSTALLYKGFPDVQYILEDLIAENDKVVLRLRVTGKHTGELMGAFPSYRIIDSNLITILRIENGKVKERWSIFDELNTARQMNLI